MSNIVVMDPIMPNGWGDMGMDWDNPNPLEWKYWAALFAARAERVGGYSDGGHWMMQYMPTSVLWNLDTYYPRWFPNAPIYRFNPRLTYGRDHFVNGFLDTGVKLDIDSRIRYPNYTYASFVHKYPECDYLFSDIHQGDSCEKLIPVMKRMRSLLMKLRYMAMSHSNIYFHVIRRPYSTGTVTWHSNDYTPSDFAERMGALVNAIESSNFVATHQWRCEHSVSHHAMHVDGPFGDPGWTSRGGTISGMGLECHMSSFENFGVGEEGIFDLHCILPIKKFDEEEGRTIEPYPSIPYVPGDVYDEVVEDYKFGTRVKIIDIPADSFPPLPVVGVPGEHENVYRFDMSLATCYADMQKIYKFKCDEDLQT